MELFPNIPKPSANLLPQQGEVVYHDHFLTEEKASKYQRQLTEEVEWKHDELILFGKKIVTKRMVAWYGDPGISYTYSRVTKHTLPWTNTLLALKKKLEETTSEHFNSCLLNLYLSGEEGMAWHSDDEKELRKHGTISSVSLGAKRRFVFKHKATKEKVELWLGHGSLLEMKGETQTHWMHSLPKSTKIRAPRINLTFRMIDKT